MYIEIADIEKHIEADIVTALSFDEDDSNIVVAIAQAISQLRSYLKATYQIDAELENTEEDRDPLLRMLALDLVVYHIFSTVDASHIPPVRVERYNAAIAFLKDAQNGDSILNIPAVVDDTLFEIKGGSNTKRTNQY